MRILYLSSVYPQPGDPTRGIYCWNLMVAAASAGHEVRVIAPWPWPRRLRHALGGGTAEAPGGGAAWPTFLYPPGLLKGTHGWLMEASAGGALRRVLAAGFRPDCVLSYWTYPDGDAALRVARRLGVPVALIVGGSDVLLLPQQSPRVRRLFTDVLRSVDEVQTVSEDLRQKVIGLGIDPGRVHLSYQGVDLALFAPGDAAEARARLGLPTGGHLLLWVGRMMPVKALDVLLAAMARLDGVTRLVLVGDGPLRKSLEAQAVGLGLGDRVTFAGPRLQRELPDWYRACDLVVLPSHSEGIPNVLREAHACGRPFVATRVGGVAELADPATSRLVEPGDPGALAEAIRATLDDPPDPSAFTPGSRSGSWESSARRLVERLEAVVEVHRLGGPNRA